MEGKWNDAARNVVALEIASWVNNETSGLVRLVRVLWIGPVNPSLYLRLNSFIIFLIFPQDWNLKKKEVVVTVRTRRNMN